MHVRKAIFQLLNILFQKVPILRQDKDEQTLLHYASKFGKTDTIKCLILV